MRKDLADMLAVDLETEDFPEDFEFIMSRWQSKIGCKMGGCAAAVACAIPEFQKAGLRMEMDKQGLGIPVFQDGHQKDGPPIRDFAAMAAVLEISKCDSEWVFAPSSYDIASSSITPAMVAKRLRDLMKGE